ncbi:MAG: SDR family oxidoreductase [Planctomycetota bacterium]
MADMARSEQKSVLHAKAVIVTGGASGIGNATCRALAREGAHVVVVDVTREKVDSTLEEVRSLSVHGDAHLGLVLDVRDEAAMASMADGTLSKFGSIDALVASAGVLRGTGSSPKPLAQISTAEWDQVLDTNLKGTFLSNRAVLPAMIRQRSGDIVNISSVSGKQGRAHDSPYCASKFGINGMSESLAEEVRPYGIRVQIVMPDAVNTPIWNQNGPVPCPPDALPPERVADLIVYLLKQPPDTVLGGVTIAPMRARRRRQKRKDGDHANGQ